ncbi:MAG: hypothetical protein GY820_25270, partial [Gammaproteobacteria bacterium]|nr:hypothetical protein [Gammaproteobacteria bacterium]
LTDDYNIANIKTAIEDNALMIGCANSLNCGSNVAIIDNLTVYFHKSELIADTLIAALESLTDDISTPALSDDEISAYVTEVKDNITGKGFSESKTAIVAFMDAYEAANRPLFYSRNKVDIDEMGELEGLLFYIQQWILDYLFIPDYLSQVEGISFETADLFPGVVRDSAERITSDVVEVDGTYIQNYANRDSFSQFATRPLGYYAAPGEVVTLVIDAALVDQGLTAVVGAHVNDLEDRKDKLNRFYRITKEFDFDATRIQVANPMGGGIYIHVPADTNLGWFDVEVKDAVKSPYFSYRDGRVSDPVEWKALVDANEVPWVDLESDKFMMTIPTILVSKLPDPSNVMSRWDEVMDAMATFQGIPTDRNRNEYFTFDTRLDHTGFASGYPMIWPSTSAPYMTEDSNKNPIYLIEFNDESYMFRTMLHEWGHSHALPIIKLEGESMNNIMQTIAYNTVAGWDIDTSLAASRSNGRTRDVAAVDWFYTKNFRNGRAIGYTGTVNGVDQYDNEQIRYQTRGFARWADLADLFGWDAVSDINNAFYLERLAAKGKVAKFRTRDEYIETTSQVLGVNAAPLFHIWGIHPSDDLATTLATTYPESALIKVRLEHYLDIAPTTNEEWLEYSAILTNKSSYFADEIAEVDALFAADEDAISLIITTQIQSIIDTYFE